MIGDGVTGEVLPDAIELRSWTDGDLPMLDRTVGEPALMTHLGGPESEEKIRDRHRRYLGMGDPDRGTMFVILLGPAKTPVGTHGYWKVELGGVTAWETGWFVLVPYQGRGIATRATLEVVERARADAPDRQIHAFPAVDNAASNAVCRKAGFRLAGEIDSEYPPGHPIRSNDWVLDPRRR